MTDDEAWAEVGRRVQAFVADLEAAGLAVTETWDRPHGQVRIVIAER